MNGFLSLFMDLYLAGHLWTLQPVDEKPKEDARGLTPWLALMHTAKVRFHCKVSATFLVHVYLNIDMMIPTNHRHATKVGLACMERQSFGTAFSAAQLASTLLTRTCAARWSSSCSSKSVKDATPIPQTSKCPCGTERKSWILSTISTWKSARPFTDGRKPRSPTHCARYFTLVFFSN